MLVSVSYQSVASRFSSFSFEGCLWFGLLDRLFPFSQSNTSNCRNKKQTDFFKKMAPSLLYIQQAWDEGVMQLANRPKPMISFILMYKKLVGVCLHPMSNEWFGWDSKNVAFARDAEKSAATYLLL
jgi:hypothetical protein